MVSTLVPDLQSHGLVVEQVGRTRSQTDTEALEVDNAAARAIDVAVALVDEVIGAADMGSDRLLGAGVGVSGPIDIAAGTVHTGEILPGWARVRPAEELGARLGGLATDFAIGTGRAEGMPELDGMMTPDDVAEVVLFALTRPRSMRLMTTTFRPMSEASWG